MHTYQQAHDLVRETHASLYPTVAIGGSATRNSISANAPQVGPSTHRDYWAFLIPLNISWEPDFWGAVRRQIESASASAQASAADLANTRLSLQGLLAVTYFQVRGIDLQAQLLRATIDAYTQTLDLTQVRLKGGLSTESDVAEAQAQLEEARAQLVTSASTARSTNTPSPSSSANPQPPSTFPTSRSPAIRPPSPPAFPRAAATPPRHRRRGAPCRRR